MANTKLLVRLRDLHEELSSINIDVEPGEHVDEETIDALGQLVTDVSNLVDQANLQPQADQLEEERKSLSDRIYDFDHQHPRVSQFLSEMTDLLSMMGI